MNKATERLKEIGRIYQEKLDTGFFGIVPENEVLFIEKQGILLGLEEGRKEVLQDLRRWYEEHSNWVFDEGDLKKFESRWLKKEMLKGEE